MISPSWRRSETARRQSTRRRLSPATYTYHIQHQRQLLSACLLTLRNEQTQNSI